MSVWPWAGRTSCLWTGGSEERLRSSAPVPRGSGGGLGWLPATLVALESAPWSFSFVLDCACVDSDLASTASRSPFSAAEDASATFCSFCPGPCPSCAVPSTSGRFSWGVSFSSSAISLWNLSYSSSSLRISLTICSLYCEYRRSTNSVTSLSSSLGGVGVGGVDTGDNFRFRGLDPLAAGCPFRLASLPVLSSRSAPTSVVYSPFRASGCSLLGLYFPSSRMNLFEFNDSEISVMVSASAPWRATDWKKSRLSRGV